MSKFKVNQFKGMDVEVDRTVLGDVKSPDASNVRLENPVGAINNDIGTQKYNSIAYDGSILAIHQLRKHGLVDIDKTMFVLQSGTWSYQVPTPPAWIDGDFPSEISATNFRSFDYDSVNDNVYVCWRGSGVSGGITKSSWDGTLIARLNNVSGVGCFDSPVDIHYDEASEYIYVMEDFRVIKTKIDGTGWTEINLGSIPAYMGSTYNYYNYGISYNPNTDYVHVTASSDSSRGSSLSGSCLIKFKMDGSDTKSYFFADWAGRDNEVFRKCHFDPSTGYIHVVNGSGGILYRLEWDGASVNKSQIIISFSMTDPVEGISDYDSVSYNTNTDEVYISANFGILKTTMSGLTKIFYGEYSREYWWESGNWYSGTIPKKVVFKLDHLFVGFINASFQNNYDGNALIKFSKSWLA